MAPLNGKGNINGNRTRTDQLIKDKDNKFTIVETKLTDQTKLSPGQKASKKHVESGNRLFEVRSDIGEFGLHKGEVIEVKEYRVISKEKKK